MNLLAAAGNETTTRLIGWAGRCWRSIPDQRRDLVKNLGLVPNAIEELLRYESPSPVQARYVTEDVEHYGKTVAAGSVMLLLTGSANRDERRFENADQFDIHRRAGGTSPSGTASTSVSAPPWPASRAASLSKKCSSVSRVGGRLGDTPCKPTPRPCAVGSAFQ